jgi:citrate lyase beta subunit
MRARRALLYVPGDDLGKLQKAAALGADSVCLDMEDGVAASRKLTARQLIADTLPELDFGRSERLVRINSVGTGLENADLEAAIAARPDGIVIPKVDDAQSLQWADRELNRAEQNLGWPPGSIILIAIVESARGILNLAAIAAASPRLQALIFGADDLAVDIGAQRTPQGWEVFYARSALVTHATAFGLQAIDMVYGDFKDLEGLQREALQGAQLGYTGKQVIHPSQVAPVQAAFTPSDQAIADALRILQVNELKQASGIGAFALEGRMVDAPIVKAARRIVERGRAAGKIP